MIENAKIGKNVKIYHPNLVNLYGCKVGNNCKIGAFVEIQNNVKIGNNVKIQAFVFIPEGVTIEDGVFIGPHVTFINDKYPSAINKEGKLKTRKDWKVTKTLVKEGASIGANSTIMCGVTIGENSMVGAGSVVIKNVRPNTIVVGNPAVEIKT